MFGAIVWSVVRFGLLQVGLSWLLPFPVAAEVWRQWLASLEIFPLLARVSVVLRVVGVIGCRRSVIIEARPLRTHRQASDWSRLVIWSLGVGILGRHRLAMIVLVSLEWQLIIWSLVHQSRRKESLQYDFLLVHLLLVLNSLIVCQLHLALMIGRLLYFVIHLLFTSESELVLLGNSLLSEFLLVIIVFEVVVKSCGRSEALEDRQHSS